MTLSPLEKYRARIDELDSLKPQLQARPGEREVGPVVARVLEVAGDVLRRQTALKVEPTVVDGALAAIPEAALAAWATSVDVADLQVKLLRASSQAVEAAIPDSPEDGEALLGFAMQDLMTRDRFESALVALHRLGSSRPDAKRLSTTLREAVTKIDKACRRSVTSLTVLNDARRSEGQLIDVEQRQQTWWLSERSGLEDDLLVKVLGGEARGTLKDTERNAHELVTERRTRRLTEDDLMRFDMGLMSSSEAAAVRAQAEKDPELKLVLAALEAGEQAIAEVTDAAPNRSAAPSSGVERAGGSTKPEIIEERSDFKVLLFRAKTVQVVVQPRRLDRLAAAAVFLPDAPNKELPSAPSEAGLSIELGAAERLIGKTAKLTVRLSDGETISTEFKL